MDKKKESSIFAQRVRVFALSQFEYLVDFGDAMAMTSSQVTGLTTGDPNPSLETLMRLKELGCSLDWATGSDGAMLLEDRAKPQVTTTSLPLQQSGSDSWKTQSSRIAQMFGGKQPDPDDIKDDIPTGTTRQIESFVRIFSRLSVEDLTYLLHSLVDQMEVRAQRRQVAKNIANVREE